MRCSGCGKDIPFAGQVCPYCQRDKSDDQTMTAVGMLFGFIGGGIGYLANGAVGAVIGFMIGAVVGIISGGVAGRKSASPKIHVANSTARKLNAPAHPARRNGALRGGLTIIGLATVFVIGIGVFVGLYSWAFVPPPPVETHQEAPSPSRSADVSVPPKVEGDSEATASLRVRDKTIRIGDTADDVFETLKPAKSKAKESGPDPAHPGSLLITHHYNVEGKSFSLTFARNPDPGPYRLIRISAPSPQEAIQSPPALAGTCIKNPREVFPVGEQIESDRLVRLTDTNCPNARYLPDERIEVRFGGKDFLIQTRKRTFSGPAYYEIVSIRNTDN